MASEKSNDEDRIEENRSEQQHFFLTNQRRRRRRNKHLGKPRQRALGINGETERTFLSCRVSKKSTPTGAFTL